MIFLPFFYLLKDNKIPVTITEWMTLMEALDKGLHDESLTGFYELCRTILVKDEVFYDRFDEVFAHYFKGAELKNLDLREELLKWLEDPVKEGLINQEMMDLYKNMSFEELLEEFKKRLQEQKERHDGGPYWIGTGGTSPFGNQGKMARPGIRVGGSSKFGSAIRVAEARRFANYRNDRVLDTRQIKMALKKLRILAREGRLEELDLDATIDKTCRNAGDIELIWHKSRKNVVKLLLLMDTGGSMSPYAKLCDRLFSAAYQSNHFKHFKAYFFHNCLEDYLYVDYWKGERIETEQIFHKYSKDYRVIIVGDAAMAPEELHWGYYASKSGLEWFLHLSERFPHTVWLNPDPPHYWETTQTTKELRMIFRMFPLTLQGLEEAIWFLVKNKKNKPLNVEQLMKELNL